MPKSQVVDMLRLVFWISETVIPTFCLHLLKLNDDKRHAHRLIKNDAPVLPCIQWIEQDVINRVNESGSWFKLISWNTISPSDTG